jgi:hypothetical protein
MNNVSSFRSGNPDDDEVTPHGSIENVSIVSPTNGEDRLSLEAMVAKASSVASNLVKFDSSSNQPMRRSTSLSTKQPDDSMPPPPPPLSNSSFLDRDQFLRRSLTLTSRADRANLISTLTERISQRMQNNAPTTISSSYNKIGTHHVIPVNGPPPAPVNAVNKPPPPSQPVSHDNNKHLVNNKFGKTISPEGDIYGFGVKFKENSKHYFDMSASYPSSQHEEAMENQKFLDALSTKLLGTSVNTPPTTSSSASKSIAPQQPQPPAKSRLNSEIESGSFNLRKTKGIVNDRSAPKF